MSLSGCNIGFGITGSFCTFDKIITQINILKEEGANIIPVFSYNTFDTDNRFCKAKDFVENIRQITGNAGISKITEAEPVGPKKMFDAMVIAPCTGNTTAKLVNGITDTPVLMAAKSHLRNSKPLIIAVSTNDALGINFQNIGRLMVMKNIFFVPFRQDDYINKPNSLVADFTKIGMTVGSALKNIQLQPVITTV